MSNNIRYFYRQEVSNSGVLRRFSVAYRTNRETGDVSYGASVFRRESPSESFNKKKHRSTALGRLNKCPVHIKSNGKNFAEIEDDIREAIRSVGVRGNRD